jgi:outer membrane protein OmpA-like peptidoglycan-associated protein
MRLRITVHVAAVALILVAGTAAAQETNLLALAEGTLPVASAPSYGGWPAVNLLDDAASTGWACPDGKIANNAFVFAMVAPATLTAFEFDTAGIDTDNSGAKDVIVEVSPTSQDAGFVPVLRATLEDRKNAQRFAAAKKVEGRWVRLTLVNNHGAEKWTELMGFRGYGVKAPPAPPVSINGTYHTSYNDFHLRHQGTAITGCYEYNEGLFDGTVEGRVAKLTWSEGGGSSHGPAVFVFAPDGASFTGYWWHDTDKDRGVDGEWSGSRTSDAVGGCPHWSGSVGGELKKDLAATGRARLYGILFDTDSAHLRAESLPTLDEVVRLLNGEPTWALTVEGHTDSTGTAAHNQPLSEQRAKAVKEYLVGKGVAAERLATVGFGQSHPVADNATELGRAANRRVELVKK